MLLSINKLNYSKAKKNEKSRDILYITANLIKNFFVCDAISIHTYTHTYIYTIELYIYMYTYIYIYIHTYTNIHILSPICMLSLLVMCHS